VRIGRPIAHFPANPISGRRSGPDPATTDVNCGDTDPDDALNGPLAAAARDTLVTKTTNSL
jgi:hypothetical protein